MNKFETKQYYNKTAERFGYGDEKALVCGMKHLGKTIQTSEKTVVGTLRTLYYT